MAETSENPGTLLVRKRWEKASLEDRLAEGRRLAEARKRAAKERAKRLKKKGRKRA